MGGGKGGGGVGRFSAGGGGSSGDRFISKHLRQRECKSAEVTKQGRAGRGRACQGMRIRQGRECGPHRPQSQPQWWPCCQPPFLHPFARFKVGWEGVSGSVNTMYQTHFPSREYNPKIGEILVKAQSTLFYTMELMMAATSVRIGVVVAMDPATSIETGVRVVPHYMPPKQLTDTLTLVG